MESAVSFPSAPLIDAETRSPTLMPPMLATFPVIGRAGHRRRDQLAAAAQGDRGSAHRRDRAADLQPLRRPAGSEGTPPPCGASCVPLPAPLDGAVLALGVTLAAAGLAVAPEGEHHAPNPTAAATTAVSASSRPRLAGVRQPVATREAPAGSPPARSQNPATDRRAGPRRRTRQDRPGLRDRQSRPRRSRHARRGPRASAPHLRPASLPRARLHRGYIACHWRATRPVLQTRACSSSLI